MRGAATRTALVIDTPGPMGQGGGAEREGSGRGEVAAGEGQKKYLKELTLDPRLWPAACAPPGCSM